MSEAEVGQSEAEVGHGDPSLVAALDALRARDLDTFSDWLHAVRFPSTAAAVRRCTSSPAENASASLSSAISTCSASCCAGCASAKAP